MHLYVHVESLREGLYMYVIYCRIQHSGCCYILYFYKCHYLLYRRVELVVARRMSNPA